MGRKPKNKGTTTKDKKVSTSKPKEEEEPEEIWDVVRVLPRKECIECRTEGCREKAVATWATNLNPEDKWDLCEECQLKDFGGWPEGVEPDDGDSVEENDGVDTEANEANQVPQATPDKEDVSSKSESESKKEDQDEKDDDKSDSTPAAIEEVVEDDNGIKQADSQADGAKPAPCTTVTIQDQINDGSTTPMDIEKDSTPPMESKGGTAPSETALDPEDEAEEIWDLKKILPHADIIKEATIKCSTEDCTLPACSIWISNLAPTTKWYSCVDCQEEDFEGWPAIDELPTSFMEPAHLRAIQEKCSKQKAPAMPVFPSVSSSPSQKTSGDKSNFVTPPPNRLGGKGATGPKAGSTAAEGANKITPGPDGGNLKPAKPSAGALAMHKKWQEAAEAMGGKDARIVVSKPAAKKLIFDLLYEAFCPMNITQVYKGLKAVVPSPVLSTCLQDMACNNDDKNPFDDSDDEGRPEEKPTTSEPYSGSLMFKSGRNASSNLYYVDHTKIKSMDQDERNTLANDAAMAKAEESNLRNILMTTLGQAQQLVSEPTNEEASVQLGNDETTLQKMEEQLAEARALKVNEKHRQKTKQKIQRMAAQWRKRKRLCSDFLIGLEENTDGSMSAKKCFSGDGPLPLDSDEMAAKSAIKYAKEKKARSRMGGGKKQKLQRKAATKSTVSEPNAGLADETFVAVLFDSQQNVKRVHVEDED